ncbi:MAG TPA: hypothetical protein VFP44_21970 [Usitatibacter sp.]|nr:hypothetical protein [Usitatibacter sp.]
MDVTATIDVPCIELPKISDMPKITLLGGAELNALMDIAASPPTDCRLNFSLLLQIGPLFGSMACLFKILNVISKLKDFVDAATPPFSKLPGTIPALIGAIGDLEKCIPPLQIPDLLRMLKSILLLILGYLACVLEQIDSILKFRATIDLSSASDNPALYESLECAQKSADAAMGNMMLSLKPLAPIMLVVKMIAGIAMPSLEIPDLASISAEGSDVEKTVAGLESMVKTLRDLVQTIPG